jgi:Glycosyl transferases group 1
MNINVLYSTHNSPSYISPLIVSERQIILGPHYPLRVERGRVRSVKTPKGRYDLMTLVSSLPADQRPELILVLIDSFQECLPEDLTSVPGRKLLLVADTHHGEAPLQKCLAYARQEPFDRIVVMHDPHHLHWFEEAQIAPTKYIPNLNVRYFPQPFNEHRQPQIIFVGQAGPLHPRRSHLLQAIRDAGLPLVVRQSSAEIAATMYNSMQIAFNCSLNGDLNMRAFEVMAAGGFLMTDRLSPQSGLEVLVRPGEHYVDYENQNDLLAKLRYYLSHEIKCLKIAGAGQHAYLKDHHPARRVRDLLSFAFDDIAAPPARDLRAVAGGDGFGQNLEERVCLYELFQKLSCQFEQLVVVADAALGARSISDLVDLPRLKIKVATFGESPSRIRQSLSRLGVIDQIEFLEGKPASCDVLLIDAGTMVSLRDMQGFRTQLLTVVTAGNAMKSVAWLASAGFSKCGENFWVFPTRSLSYST